MEQKQLANLRPTDSNEVEIDLLDLLGFYLSKIYLFIIAVIVGAVVAGLYTHYCLPDQFTATSRMYMVSASSDSVVNLTDLNLGTSLSNDYVVLMKSRPVIEEVIDKLDLSYSYEKLSSMVNLSVVSGTRIIRISATSTDPEEAMNIANQMAKTTKVQLPKVMESPSPTIVEEAVLPTQKSAPSMKRNVLIGALLMIVLVAGVLTVIYLMDDTIKTSEDVEKMFGVMPLSVIPDVEIEGFAIDEDGGRRTFADRMRKKKKGGAKR